MHAVQRHAPIPVIIMLLGYQADVNHFNKDSLTPLVMAANYRCSAQVVQALIDYGADVNYTQPNGETVFATFAV